MGRLEGSFEGFSVRVLFGEREGDADAFAVGLVVGDIDGDADGVSVTVQDRKVVHAVWATLPRSSVVTGRATPLLS